MKRSEPEQAAWTFLFHIIAKHPDRLNADATAIRGEDYTAANDLSDDELGLAVFELEYLPVVIARDGETFRVPSGELVAL